MFTATCDPTFDLRIAHNAIRSKEPRPGSNVVAGVVAVRVLWTARTPFSEQVLGQLEAHRHLADLRLEPAQLALLGIEAMPLQPLLARDRRRSEAVVLGEAAASLHRLRRFALPRV